MQKSKVKKDFASFLNLKIFQVLSNIEEIKKRKNKHEL